MKEIGIVSNIKGKYATVEFPRKTACENCHMCLKSKDKMFVSIRVINSLNASIGDSVSVQMPDKAVLSSAAIIYLIPLLLVGISFAITYKMSEIWQIVGMIGALILSIVVYIIAERIYKKIKLTAEMVEIINNENNEKQENLE